jgi:hypothetical protein
MSPVRATRRLIAGLPLAIFVGCAAWSEPGVRVELHSRPSVYAGEALRGSAGAVRIEELRWTSSEIELLTCSSAGALGAASIVRAAGRWLLPSAQAHGLSSPTLRAVPTIVDAFASGGVGDLTPPAGQYCGVRYRIAPADADAIGISGAPEMLGTSFVLRAALDDGAGGERVIELASQQTLDVTLDVDVELSSEQRGASLAFGCDAERWVRDVDLGQLAFSDGASEDAILAAFRASFGVQVE